MPSYSSSFAALSILSRPNSISLVSGDTQIIERHGYVKPFRVCQCRAAEVLIVKGTPPSSLTKFVEVIGIADSDKSIQASIWNNFGDTIDTHAYNQLCLLANGDFKHLFI
ncbi:hypothetical protein ACLB2K_060030 [Fragaria x ananassa]